MDTIIRKVSVRANYNELTFGPSSMVGFDYLDVSRRSFQRIHVILTDSYGKAINLKSSQWSMIILCFRRRGELFYIYSNQKKYNSIVRSLLSNCDIWLNN